MAAVEVGVQQVKHFNTDALILFLSKHGISQNGLKALRDNQVEGEMLLEFTDADLKDIFEVFKDRFLIRKLLRGLYGPNNTPCRMGRTIAPSVPTTQVVASAPIPSATTMSSSVSPATIAVSMPTKINSQTVNRLPSIHSELQNNLDYVKSAPQTNLQKETYLNTAVNSDSLFSRVKIPTNPVRLFPSPISNHEKITSRLIAAGTARSTSIPVSNTTNVSIYSTPKTFETQTTPVQQSNIKPHVIEDDDDDDDDDITDNDVHVIDGWGSSRIKDFSAEELLRRKMRRGRPTEAQRLGRSLLREAATTANIWNTAPPLKMITADKKEAFFHYICRAAPQLSRHKQFVWIRLGEALQNRRKYLSDKECGRRTTKRRRDSEIGMTESHHLLPSSGSSPSSNVANTTTTANLYSLASSLKLSTLSSSSATHSSPSSSSSSVKNEVEPIVIEADSLPLLQDPSSQSPSVMRTTSPIETINLTTLIKEEVESEEMKCWSET